MRFQDGTFIDSIPHDTHHYHVIAHRLGYGDDIMAYSREHDVCHAIMAEWFGDVPSPIFWAMAHGEPHDHWGDVYEELAVMALQRFVRANERPIVADVDWDALKARALEVLG